MNKILIRNIIISALTLSVLIFVFTVTLKRNLKNSVVIEKKEIDYSDSINSMLNTIEEKNKIKNDSISFLKEEVSSKDVESIKIIFVQKGKKGINVINNNSKDTSFNEIEKVEVNNKLSSNLPIYYRDTIYITDTIYQIDTIFYRKEDIKKLKLKKRI